MNFSINNINPAFTGTMLIPTAEMMKQGPKANETMRQIGMETAKFAKPEDMEMTKDGILVKIDDNREKEYQAIIAKYGIQVQKTDAKINPNNKGDLSTYKFMVSKLTPNEADAKAEKFEKMTEEEKNKEYIKVYNEFKQSPHSMENAEATK